MEIKCIFFLVGLSISLNSVALRPCQAFPCYPYYLKYIYNPCPCIPIYRHRPDIRATVATRKSTQTLTPDISKLSAFTPDQSSRAVNATTNSSSMAVHRTTNYPSIPAGASATADGKSLSSTVPLDSLVNTVDPSESSAQGDNSTNLINLDDTSAN